MGVKPVLQEFKRSLVLHKGQRTRLPSTYVAPEDVSIWEIIRSNLGKDFSRFTVPVFMNEPLCFLQRLSENVQYNYLLEKAAECDDDLERIEYVAAFALATISSNHKRLSKPFNPLLLETFELERNGVRFIAEQVSHHPPISAVYAESDDFTVEGTVEPTIGFWMNKLIANPHAHLKLTFKKTGEIFSWSAPKCTIYNVIMGKMYMNFTSQMKIESTGGYDVVFSFENKGYYNHKGGDVHVEGHIFEGKNKIRTLYGNWTLFLASCDVNEFKACRKEYVNLFNESVNLPNQGPVVPGSKILWVANQIPKLFEEQFHFTYFTLTLNEMYDGLSEKLPPTDSRLRKDMKFLEDGKNDEAEECKRKYEDAQRARRAKNTGNVPLWFSKVDGVWKYTGDYWSRDFSQCLELFEKTGKNSNSFSKDPIMFVYLCLLIAFSSSIEIGGPSRRLQKPTGPRQEVSIAVVYQHYVGRSITYDKAIKDIIRSINDATAVSSLRRLSTRYVFSAVDCILPTGTFNVKEVLDCLCNNVTANNVALIVFMTASELYDTTTAAEQYFLTAASYTGIPIIAWNADNSGFTFGKDLSPYRIIQMAPPIAHQIRAMIALLQRYNWPKFGVVTSDMAGGEEFVGAVRDELENFSNRSTKFEMLHYCHINTTNKTDIDVNLIELRKNQAKIILLYSNVHQANAIFSRADVLKMTNEKYLWIGTQSVKGTHKTVKSAAPPGMLSVNFHTVSNAMFYLQEDVIPLIIQLAPKLFGSALLQLRQNETFPLRSNVSCRRDEGDPYWQNGKIIYDHMKSSFVKGNPFHANDGHDSFFYVFDKNGRLKNSVLQISNLRTNTKGEKYWEKVGIYTNNELSMADVQWPGKRANPPQGTADSFHVNVVTLHEPPFIIVSDVDPDTGRCPGNQGSICDWGDVEYTAEGGIKKNRTLWKCCSGYCVDLLNKLATDIGFTYTLYKVRDEKWGLKSETGWNGLIADLMHNKADMCVTSLKLNSERARDIDFSLPFLDTGISIIVKIRSGVLSPTAFLEPFEYSTWVIILFVCIHVAAISIFAFEWVSPYSFNMQKYPPPGHKFSLFRSYWLVWATLFSASVSTDVPKSTVSRLMALVWAAFGLTFLAVYTANLAAFMITRVQFYDLSGIHDPMLSYPQDQKPPFRFGTVDGGNTHETMKRNWQQMHEYVKRNNFFRMNISAGVDAVKKEELDAFIYDAVVLDYWAGKDANCALMTVGKWASMTGYGIGFPKNSPYTAMVNQHMLRYQQNGDLERLQNFWLTGACTPDSHSQTQSAPLGIENFMSAFFLLGVGIIISIIILGLEHIYCIHLRKPLQKIDKKGWCGIISMAMGKSLTFTEAVDRVQEWRSRTQSLASTSSPQLKRRRSANSRTSPERKPPSFSGKQYLQVETNL
ncbi:unnamed protein product [Caenorhabditis bovis]|uniref:Oxysterol-binding protein n=1 Tax=Caenorhabditis bovis TaxID=2654633 RepID=A0A8S1EBI9_9PELO|nr:unnamed protein product [Caenorhabditis bovis]